jgi:signal transduction histidine kinase
VVDDLFLLARVDGGHQVLNLTSLYLDDVVRDTVRVARPLADAKGVRVEVSGAVDEPFQGDPDLLGRLLLNLIDNAIRHSPEEGWVKVSMIRRDGSIEIAVVDSGPGIPDDVQERVFERFFQVDSSRTRDGGTLTSGAGLGLAIGRRIAEMHQGRLELATSRPGQTEFLLILPVGGVSGVRLGVPRSATS